MFRSLDHESIGTANLYRQTISGGANVLFPPMFHRPPLLCERVSGITKRDLYTWTQEQEKVGSYGIGGRSLEDAAFQTDTWEQYFGDICDRWTQAGTLRY
jgi:hypothetical protein